LVGFTEKKPRHNLADLRKTHNASRTMLAEAESDMTSQLSSLKILLFFSYHAVLGRFFF
jgi:hypothetical protein